MSENGDNENKKNESESIIEEKNEESTQKEEKQEIETEPKPKKKYIFNCTKCGQCCEKREIVPVSFADVRRWNQSGVINSVFPHLKFRTLQTTGEKPQEFLALGLVGSEIGCPMFDKENKVCNIYHSLPIECKAFPLGYNGKNYYIKDKSVPGLGQGTMTKEQLITDRDNAREDFESKVETQMMLPLLYSLFMQNIVE
ncbi:MAG: YkgJ family cysteine cluster protein, partial [Candidatus Hodarchaeales archaeon]